MRRVEELLEMAQRDFARQGHIEPAVLIHAGGRSLAYPMTQRNEQQRDAFFDLVNAKARELGADSVSVVTEAWIREEGQELDPARLADAIYAIDVSPVGRVDVAAVRVVRSAHGVTFERLEPAPGVRARANLIRPWRTAQ